MAAAAEALIEILAVDAPTASIVVALLTAAGVIGVRWVPKTRSEAGVDRSTAHKLDVEALGETIDRLVSENRRLDDRVDELENQLKEERRDCDRKIAALEQQIHELREQLT